MSEPYDIHLADQLAAAIAQSRQMIRSLDTPASRVRPGVPPWVADKCEQFLRDHLDKPRGCLHLEHPQPLWGFTSLSGALLCRGCMGFFMLVNPVAPCERCGAEGPEGFYGLVNTGGVLTLIYAVCGPCKEMISPTVADHGGPSEAM
ncbi:hypothetical protein [Spongiactinospora sp. TRM90649]|uniref:hypothetical protein n=1 Tax=Spongiactinospora sp. TRM90649 TaxID=3031114 RepID=UPI0023F7834D|nr:hypothetical protein [Spongiactinospora sp. TRM90649]MDF5756617.1 hypothetical protein [Spongiactinospora sp. TRM90649]